MTEEDGEARSLREENDRLKKENEYLRKIVDDLRREIEDIIREFEEYKKRHPETVGVRHGKPYIIRTTEAKGTQAKPGAKVGHSPNFRKTPEKIDSIRMVPVTGCPHCNSDDLSRVQEIRTRVIEDIPVCTPLSLSSA